MAALIPSAPKKKKADDSDDEEPEIDVLLRKAIVLTTEVQFFRHYSPPTLEEGGILAALPPTGDKPWRVEMNSDVLTEGGVKRILRVTRRGVMFFCEGDTVELSMSLAPVTMLEAVYESTWETADGYVALDRAPLDRQGHPNPHPDILCVMHIPHQDIKIFEQLCTIFGKCTRRSARRHRDLKPISIVQRHAYKNEMTKYAAKLAEEEEARKFALEEGVDGANFSLPASIQKQKEDEEKKRQEEEDKEAAEIAAAAKAEEERLKKEAEEKRLADEKGSDGTSSPLLSPDTLALSGDLMSEEGEQEIIISINPFSHGLIHEPDKFNSTEDSADMTALDADWVRRKRDIDTDAQLFTQTRAVYFGQPKDERTTAGVDTLSSLLQKGREVAALGSSSAHQHQHNNHTNNNTSGSPSPSSSSTRHPLDDDHDGASNNNQDNPLSRTTSSGAFQQAPPQEQSVSPSRFKPFMEAYSYRETTRVQRAQLDAFFQDAEAERREEQAKEAKMVALLLRDVKLMTKSLDTGFRDAREHKLSGIGAPRRRTPPWLKPQALRKPPAVSTAPRLRIDVNSEAGRGRVLNPFGGGGAKSSRQSNNGDSRSNSMKSGATSRSQTSYAGGLGNDDDD